MFSTMISTMRDYEKYQEGFQEGFQEGLQEGILEGVIGVRIDATQRLIDHDKTNEEIHEIIGYPMDFIQEVRANYTNKL